MRAPRRPSTPGVCVQMLRRRWGNRAPESRAIPRESAARRRPARATSSRPTTSKRGHAPAFAVALGSLRGWERVEPCASHRRPPNVLETAADERFGPVGHAPRRWPKRSGQVKQGNEPHSTRGEAHEIASNCRTTHEQKSNENLRRRLVKVRAPLGDRNKPHLTCARRGQAAGKPHAAREGHPPACSITPRAEAVLQRSASGRQHHRPMIGCPASPIRALLHPIQGQA